MLDEIRMRDVALIREATMMPAAGLTVVTGETGSGKTALLSGIKLLIGERGDSEMIRDGAEGLEVEGRFFPGPVSAAEAALDGLIAKRSISADGRSRVHLDGSLATVGDLANGPGARVDLCGQHEHQQLLKTANQVKLLDAWAGEGLAQVKQTYLEAYRAAKCAAEDLAHVEEAGRADSSRIEDARYIVRRIDELNPRQGEYEELLAEVARIENAEELSRAIECVRESLSADGGALDEVARAAAALESISGYDAALSAQAAPLREAGFLLEDAVREVAAHADDDSFDANRLEELQERLSSFQGLMRAYGPTMVEVAQHRQEAAAIIEAVDGHDELLEKARRELDASESALARAAEMLAAARKKAAPAFARAVCEQMDELEMGGAELLCSVEPLDRSGWTESGPDKVEFLFRPGQGMGTRPLNRIASGGEISRVMLAIKVVLGASDEVDTLVFDEVDAGVGGKTARAVAEVLVALAQTHQVIVVTHLPQIAIEGDVHYLVEKTEGALPETTLIRLDGAQRVDEIARMLAGEVTKTSRAHAEELLAEAHTR